jgi:glutaconate CoA-transferase subunit A
LDVVGPIAGMPAELLVATDRVRSIAAPHMGCDPTISIAPAFRAAVESGRVRVRECDEGTLITSLRAAGQRLPYLPWRGGVGTDLARVNPDLRQYVDPVSGVTLMRIPAQHLDVALLRAYEADSRGNVRYHRHSSFSDPAFARAADRVIVEVERLVPHQSFLDDPDRTSLHRVDAVVVAPLGGYPYRSAGVMDQDDVWLRHWNHEVRLAVAGGMPVSSIAVVRREVTVSGEEQYLHTVGYDRLSALVEDRRALVRMSDLG